MDLGFSTHATHPSNRLVWLESKLSKDRTELTITAPPNGKIYPPGPGYLYLTVDDVSSEGKKIMIGSGGNPPVAWE